VLNNINQSLERLTQLHLAFFNLVLIAGLGLLDYLIGPELSFSVFYTGPIMLATWYGGRSLGAMIALLCSAVWLVADLSAGSQYSSHIVPLWNTLVRLAFFLIILQLLYLLKQKLELEANLADTDALTGLANRRFFEEQIEREHIRMNRYPQVFTIAYIDLDNFKQVNDQQGHQEGDLLLQSVASSLSQNIRSSDIAARMGGDEFAILFPHLDATSAEALLKKLQQAMLKRMTDSNWAVTFSIGAVSFASAMDSSREMIKVVDDLMYQVKHNGKNSIRHQVWENSQ